MKKKNIVIGLILTSFVFLGCNSSSETSQVDGVSKKDTKTSINVKGSETVLPISEKAANIYSKIENSQLVSVTGGGSGVGISALMSNNTDIAQTSRKIKFSEQQKFLHEDKEVREVIIAYDALAIVVHPENKVSELTREQLEGIFTGKITNWKEVGGEDLGIIPYSRETSSGTYEFFKEIILKNKNFMSGIMSMPANGAIIQSVSQTKGSIAYVGVAYLNQSVKGIGVSFDGGETFAVPTVENAKDRSYPVVRPLYYYYQAESEEYVKGFMDFILSAEGQKVVEEVGYITIH